MNAEEILNQYASGERNFPAVNLTEANLSGVNLSKANLSGANLTVANLCGSNLSEADLSKAKLNVAKLSGANLTKANLYEANLNVANLTLADLSKAEMRQASLVRAEMARADLSGANLSYANLSGADLKDAKLRGVNLSHANLSRADMKWATFTGANLSMANMHGADLSSADLSGADLSHTELRQATLSRANFQGVNLSGANLRWADLSGADLSWADLSGARLSGANLTGVNLSNANLLGTILVHADLTRASLIDVDWAGADLSGATLSGAKLHGVLRFGIKTEGMICEWVDLSPNGDQSKIYKLDAASMNAFFHEAPPTVCLTVDATFDQEAHYALAIAYRQLATHYQVSMEPPNIQIGRRRTTLTFEIQDDTQLFMTTYLAICPFNDAVHAQSNLLSVLDILQSANSGSKLKNSNLVHWVNRTLNIIRGNTEPFTFASELATLLAKVKFFDSPTQMTLMTSTNQSLAIYNNPHFGKRLKPATGNAGNAGNTVPAIALEEKQPSLPAIGLLIEFIHSFQEIEAERSPQPATGSTELS
ncbi:MAG: pentapeptide repeat-containing protein [Leptolyngbyaceae cyanobacterium CAN_BIN12]|nr:pentapeptide repeat-containing protein [Leptolyngbyaceae cyanobacterium CAN_BIN12]